MRESTLYVQPRRRPFVHTHTTKTPPSKTQVSPCACLRPAGEEGERGEALLPAVCTLNTSTGRQSSSSSFLASTALSPGGEFSFNNLLPWCKQKGEGDAQADLPTLPTCPEDSRISTTSPECTMLSQISRKAAVPAEGSLFLITRVHCLFCCNSC